VKLEKILRGCIGFLQRWIFAKDNVCHLLLIRLFAFDFIVNGLGHLSPPSIEYL
jgi:hypothetical protein